MLFFYLPMHFQNFSIGRTARFLKIAHFPVFSVSDLSCAKEYHWANLNFEKVVFMAHRNGEPLETQLTPGINGPGRPLRLRRRSRLRGGGRSRLPKKTAETSLPLRDEDEELQTKICYTNICLDKEVRTKICIRRKVADEDLQNFADKFLRTRIYDTKNCRQIFSKAEFCVDEDL